MTRKSRAQETLRLVAETKASQLAAVGWLPLKTIPRDRPVMIHSVTGIECRAKVQDGASVHNGMIACWRREGGVHCGHIKAVAWREP